MRFNSMGYCFRQGIKNIGRNRVFSLASVATMSLCIFILGIVYSITANVNYMVEKMSESLCVKVFFENDIEQEQITKIGECIKDYSGVTIVHFTSAEEAWNDYKERYFGDDYIELAEGYDKDNPLKNSASYEVYFSNSSMQDKLVKYIEGLKGVRRVNSSDVTADSLTEISKLVSMVSLVVLAILFAIALFLINNTIAIGISVRDGEIKIMKLLGARNGFIRAPFIVEGIIIGTIGAVIPIGLVYAFYENVVSYVLTKFSFLSSILSFMPVQELFKVFLPLALILGIGLGLLGSLISITKHLSNR